MQKFNQLFLAFLTIATFITCTSTAKQRPEGGWLWNISGNCLSHPSYLFGTYHGTYDILYQYTDSIPELHQAFNACSQFAGESETTSKPTPAQVGAAIKLPKDTTYADLLNKEDFHFLDSIVRQSLKSPLNKMYIKPNFLALILGEIEKGKKLVDTGYSQSRIDSMKSQVMDIALEKKAKEKGLTIVGLEDIFDAFVSEKSNLKKEADELISSEGLNIDAAKRYINVSLKRGYASEQGTDLNDALPKMSPLNPQYLTKKQSIFQKIVAFVEKFVGIGGEV